MKRLKNILIWVFLINCYLQAQNTTEYYHHLKYWYYKTRLNNDFVKVGTNQGESMPFNERAVNFSDKMKIGDGTARLGIYLGVLATEYRLLKNSGQNVDKVKHELFCALNALNRVDFNAERKQRGYSLPQDLNGFFIRDDVPLDLVINNYQHFNYYNNGIDANGNPINQSQDKGFTQFLHTGGVKGVESTWSGNISKTTFESQDQLYYLLMGLTLVYKLVAPNEYDGNNTFAQYVPGTGNGDIKQEAKNILKRLIEYVGNKGYKIINPVTNNPVKSGSNAKAYAYPLASIYCFVVSDAAMPDYFFTTGGSLSLPPLPCNVLLDSSFSMPSGISQWISISSNDGAPPGGLGGVDVHGFFNTLAGSCNCVYDAAIAIDNIIQDQINALLYQINQLYNAMNQAIQEAINNLPEWLANKAEWILNHIVKPSEAAFLSIINGLWSLVQSLYELLYIGIKINTTEERLIRNTTDAIVRYSYSDGDSSTNLACEGSYTRFGSDLYFGIYLRDVLHPKRTLPAYITLTSLPPYTISRYSLDLNMEVLLSMAPCKGTGQKWQPINNPSPQYAPPEWHASNRLDRPDRNWYTCGDPSFQGEYNGTDYMLLHNLYYLYKGTINFKDYSDRVIDTDFPLSNGQFSTSNKHTIGAFEYLTATNTIHSNGAATYKAGKEIRLLHDFSVEAGADFEAYIDPIDLCSNEEMSRLSTTNTNATNTTPSVTLSKNITIDENKSNVPNTDSLIKSIEEQVQYMMDTTLAKIPIKVEVFPNPINSEQWKEVLIGPLLGTKIIKEVQIINMEGKVVVNYNDINRNAYFITLKLKNIAKGMYFIRIIDSKENISNHKLIIE